MSVAVVLENEDEDKEEDEDEEAPGLARAGECSGVRCPDPFVFPDSISKAVIARAVEREREQPRKT